MLPFKQILEINQDARFSMYLKIANAFIKAINEARLVPGVRIPSSRNLAEMLMVHRKTVVAAYSELADQGWIVSKGRLGTYVNDRLPTQHAKKLKQESLNIESETKSATLNYNYKLDGGNPDIRITPLKELGRASAALLRKPSFIKSLEYEIEYQGDIILRRELVKFLRDTRGIYRSIDEIMITRGSSMGFYLIIANYISKKDNVVVAYPGYYYAFESAVTRHGGKIIKVGVDDKGLDVDALEKICKQKKIKLVMIIPHHHYPTTATLTASRRIKLLKLAKQYNFRIIEDDWDYDFHYRNNPILPLASIDQTDKVLYIGSMSKIISPALRIGYIVGNKEIIQKLKKHRRIIDRAGDVILERALAELFKLGIIESNIRKVKKIYKQRRDLMFGLMKKNFDDVFEMKLPSGGMGIWAKYKDPSFHKRVIANIEKERIYTRSKLEEGMLIGFACTNEKEIAQRIQIIKKLLKD